MTKKSKKTNISIHHKTFQKKFLNLNYVAITFACIFAVASIIMSLIKDMSPEILQMSNGKISKTKLCCIKYITTGILYLVVVYLMSRYFLD